MSVLWEDTHRVHRMWKGKTVSVVFSTYREKASIRSSIEDFFNTGLVDEIVVVNNNAEPGTDDEVKKTRARLVYETKQGYGYGYQRGIQEAKGDYIILSEPDGTYAGGDVEKLLVYGKEFPVVVGSRNNQSTIFEVAAMGFLRKWANLLVAKVIELLFNTNALTEVGCTYKLFRRDILKELEPYWHTRNALFATELLLLVISKRIPFIEIPIVFRERVGTSSLTAHWYNLVKWGLHILFFILSFWTVWIFGKLFRRGVK